MITCRNCAKELPPEAYYVSVRQPCKECVKERVRQHRAKNLERIQEYDRQRSTLPHRKQGVKNRAHRYLEQKKQWVKQYKETQPHKNAARNAVNNAVRDGKLKPTPCERCGYGIGVQAHHEDYSKPLEVNWLCKPCHGQRHREINAERRRNAA